MLQGLQDWATERLRRRSGSRIWSTDVCPRCCSSTRCAAPQKHWPAACSVPCIMFWSPSLVWMHLTLISSACSWWVQADRAALVAACEFDAELCNRPRKLVS